MPALPFRHSWEGEGGRGADPVGQIRAPPRLGGWLQKVASLIAKLKILILIIIIITNNSLPPKWEFCSFCDLFFSPFVTN